MGTYEITIEWASGVISSSQWSWGGRFYHCCSLQTPQIWGELDLFRLGLNWICLSLKRYFSFIQHRHIQHTNHIFSERSWSKDIKSDITKCLIHKYTNTNPT